MGWTVSSMWRSRLLLLGLTLASVLSAQPVLAACGEFYRVQRGDTLRSITVARLGHDRFGLLFQANRDVLSNPSRIEIGQLLYIPCEGQAGQTRAQALAAAGRSVTPRDDLGDRRAPKDVPRVAEPKPPETVTPQQPAGPAAPRIVRPAQVRLLAYSGIPPLTDDTLPGGGLAATLITAALKAANVPVSAETVFVNDRRAHLQVLMPLDAFALGAPWPAPNCQGQKGAATQQMCRDFLFSRPIYQMQIATWVAQTDASVATAGPNWFGTRRVCRPSGLPAVDLEAMAPAPTVVLARTPAACFALLSAGQVDAVSLPAATPVQQQGVKRAARLDREIPVHALAWRQDPQARKRIDQLNSGLARLQASGQWFSIVSQYLSNYRGGTSAPAN